MYIAELCSRKGYRYPRGCQANSTKTCDHKKDRVLNTLKDRLKEALKEYQKQHCDKNEKIKRQNITVITRTEEKVMKDVKVYAYEWVRD